MGGFRNYEWTMTMMTMLPIITHSSSVMSHLNWMTRTETLRIGVVVVDDDTDVASMMHPESEPHTVRRPQRQKWFVEFARNQINIADLNLDR